MALCSQSCVVRVPAELSGTHLKQPSVDCAQRGVTPRLSEHLKSDPVDCLLRPKLAQMMIEVLVLCDAPLGTAQTPEETMDVAVAARFSHRVKIS
jgi:hypothetical protein